MSADTVLAHNDDFPVRTEQPVHSGKVRAVYWLTAADSARLIESRGYPVAPDAQLALMVISDRLSAFDCIWRAEQGLDGVPGKGAALNAVSLFWFERFRQMGLARSHVLESPHPLVWIVERARPIKIEAIARRYITGSMWRAYEQGERRFCGIDLPDGLEQDSRLPELLVTPSTKGVLEGIPGVPAVDDVNVSRDLLASHWQQFGFADPQDIERYEQLLREGFGLIETHLAAIGQLFVDTKFEFGYVSGRDGVTEMIYMDEVGTPDSSRLWEAANYDQGLVADSSKEAFRQALLSWVPDRQLLLDKDRMSERSAYAAAVRLPRSMFEHVATAYRQIAEQITGKELPRSEDPRGEIMTVLAETLELL